MWGRSITSVIILVAFQVHHHLFIIYPAYVSHGWGGWTLSQYSLDSRPGQDHCPLQGEKCSHSFPCLVSESSPPHLILVLDHKRQEESPLVAHMNMDRTNSVCTSLLMDLEGPCLWRGLRNYLLLCHLERTLCKAVIVSSEYQWTLQGWTVCLFLPFLWDAI